MLKLLATFFAGILATTALAACGSGNQNEYTEASKTAMLRACTEDDEDKNLTEVCVCVEEQIEQDVPYSEFAEWEKRLRTGESYMPGRLATLIRGCIQSVSETR